MTTQRIRTAEEQLEHNSICKVVAGSHAYGTNVATSDEDYRGIFVADPINIRTPLFPIREVTDSSEEDTKIYELSQFVKLMINCNPNILEIAWCDDEHILTTSEEFVYLRQRAPEFLSKKAAHTFTGYAISQLKRIKGHKKWIVQQENAERLILTALSNGTISIDFVNEHLDVKLMSSRTQQVLQHTINVPAPDDISILKHQDVVLFTLDAPYHEHYTTVINGTLPSGNNGVKLHWLTNGGQEGTIYGAYVTDNPRNKLIDSHHRLVVDNEFSPPASLQPAALVKFNKQQFNEDCDRRSKFRNWKEHRNETRFALEDQFGYDTKHASHIVRLMNMGTEILTEGIVRVKRPDADMLKAIRAGEWTYDELLEFAEEKDVAIRETLYRTSTLPKAPDLFKAAQMIMTIQDMHWSKKD